jgi:hypothetical protein
MSLTQSAVQVVDEVKEDRRTSTDSEILVKREWVASSIASVERKLEQILVGWVPLIYVL